MWRAILAIIPWDSVLPWIYAKLAQISYDKSKQLIDIALNKVVEVERKYGNKEGELKAQEVKQYLYKQAHGLSKWAINFLIELVVGYAKRKKLIK